MYQTKNNKKKKKKEKVDMCMYDGVTIYYVHMVMVGIWYPCPCLYNKIEIHNKIGNTQNFI